MRRKTKASNERLQPALSRAPGPGPFLLTSVKDPRQNPPRPHPFLLTSFKYPPSTTPRPLAPYSSADPALPDLPVIGAPSTQIRNSQHMWVSRLIRGPWSYLKGLASASSQGCVAQTAGFVHFSLLFCCLWKCTAPSAPIGCQVLPRWSRKKRSSRPG
jgi:hypothetical protein